MKGRIFFTAMCCLSAAGLLTVRSANAQTTIAESGFNNLSGIADPNPLTAYEDLDAQGGTGLGWDTPWTKYRPDDFSNGSAMVVDNFGGPVYEGDQLVMTSGGTELENWAAYARGFTAQSQGRVLVEFSFRAGSNFAGFNMYVSDFDNGSVLFEDFNASLGIASLRPDGSLWQYLPDEPGGTPANTAVMTQWGKGSMEIDTWYRIGMLFDTNAQTYQISLDDIEGDLYDGQYDVPRPWLINDVPATKATTLISINASPTVYLDEFRVVSLPALSVPGDTDGDTDVDQDDAAVLAGNWLAYNEAFSETDGDFNGDGWVNEIDASILAANWTGPLGEGTAVPEPSILVLLATAALGLFWVRWK